MTVKGHLAFSIHLVNKTPTQRVPNGNRHHITFLLHTQFQQYIDIEHREICMKRMCWKEMAIVVSPKPKTH